MYFRFRPLPVYFPHQTFVFDVSEIPISFPFPELPFSILFPIKNMKTVMVLVFTDRFLRLPVFVGNYRICVSEFSGIVSRNFSELCLGIFQHVFFRIACTSLDKDYLFLSFLDILRFFWDRWCWKAVEINDLVFSTH